MKKVILCLIMLIILTFPSSATDYYIKPDGNNANTGLSIDQAWKNLSWAVASSGKVVAGNTIYLLNGTYIDKTMVNFYSKPSGNSTHPIIIRAYNGTKETVRISGGDGNEQLAGGSNPYGLSVYGNSYITFSDIWFSNYSTIGRTYDTDYIIFNNMKWSGSSDGGVDGNSNLFNLRYCNYCLMDGNSFYVPAGYTALNLLPLNNNSIISNLYFNGIDGHPNIQVDENNSNITIHDVTIENTIMQGILFYKTDTLANGKIGTNVFSIYNASINGAMGEALEFWSSKNGAVSNITIVTTNSAGTPVSLTSRAETDRNENITFSDLDLTGQKYNRIDNANNITFIRIKTVWSGTQSNYDPNWRLGYSSVYPSTNITFQDMLDTSYTASMTADSSLTLYYSDGTVFNRTTTSGSATIIEPRYYSTGSNSTANHTGTAYIFSIIKYNMTVKPSFGYAEVTTDGTDLFINQDISDQITIDYTITIYSNDSNTQATFNISTGKPNTLLTLNRNGSYYIGVTTNATGWFNYLYDNSFSTYQFQITENASNIGNLSGYINSTEGNPIEDVLVRLSYTNGSYLSTVNTSADGSYNFTNVNSTPGYYIFAKWINESSAKSTNFSIISNSTVWQNLTLIQTENVTTGQNVFVDLSNSFDFESDTVSYSTNRTDLFTDFSTTTGKGNWTTSSADNYSVKFGASDDVGYSNKTIIFEVTTAALTYNISGYVNNTLGLSISSVSVINGTNSTTTNATGYYLIPTMSNGTYNFSYSKAGYVTGYKDITVAGADVVNQNVTLNSSSSTIIIPSNSWGMFNNWSTYNTTFSGIAANESNDVTYTYYNTTSGEWESYYIGYTYNQNNPIGQHNSVLGFFNAQTTITATTVTPSNTDLPKGWNMLYVEGTSNQTLADIQTNIELSCTVNDLYKYNSTINDYTNTVTESVQPNEGFMVDIASGCTWTRTTI